MSTSTISPESSSSQHPKPKRVLACVLCQQRKIRCDRKFPCINCTKSRTQCVPSTLGPRQRKRRFPERELLERIRSYESLLRQNNIRFEPLHKDSPDMKESPNTHNDSDHEQPEVHAADSPSSRTVKSEDYGAKNVFHAMSHGFRDPDRDDDSEDGFVRETDFKTAWDLVLENSDQLLFGSRNSIEAVDLSTLHPEPVHIFRLWQIYLDNVNPLLKVTHTPSLQGRIVDAISNMTNISPNLEALMFSIYCMAVQSFTHESDKCQAIFGSAQEDLLTRFRFGCQQALLNCGFLRTDDRDCLTALYLYLLSVRQGAVPSSLSSMIGIAIRIAQRMGMNSESALANCETVLEAEMRRRLWWSLVLFDTRIGEMADFKAAATLNPTWDCRIPLNVNDSDLSDIKELPAVQGRSTETLFAVVRAELGEFLRHSTYYLETTCPALKTVAKSLHPNPNSEDSGSELDNLEKMIEDKYLKLCDPDNHVHFMTIWFARGFIAKCRLTEHHVRCFSPSGPIHQTEQQRSIATSHALRLLECDTQCTSSPLIKGFLWLTQLYFPFPAYLQITQDLRTRPSSEEAEKAWDIMSDNYEARFANSVEITGNVFVRSRWFKLFAGVVIRAWDAREAAFSHQVLMPPRIISSIRHTLTQITQNLEPPGQFPPSGGVGMGLNMFPAPIPKSTTSDGSMYGMGVQEDYGVTPASYTDIPPGQLPPGIDVNSIDWSAMNWGFGGNYTGDWDTRLEHM